VDHRADIFAFGAVLYKMINGRDAFDRGTAVGTMNAILTENPADFAADRRLAPPALESIILHCLEKAPEDRFQSALDLEYTLEACAAPMGALSAEPPRGKRLRGVVIPAAAAVGCLMTGTVLGYMFHRAQRFQPSVDGRIFAPVTDEAGAELFPSLSADARVLAYAGKSSGNWDIYVRRLGTNQSLNLTRSSVEDDTQPAFSPDATQIAFRSDGDGGGIFVMRADGTGLRRISDAGYNPAWSPDGTQILYAEEGITRPEDRSGRLSRLWAVDLASGRKRMVTRDDAVQPQWSPNGRYIAYWAIDLDSDRDLWTIPAEGGQPIRITRDHYLDWNPVWSPDGAWIYFCSNRGGSMGIWRIPMKEGSGEARGSPEPIRTPASYPSHLSFARDGKHLAYTQQQTTGRIFTVRYDPEADVLRSEPKEILASLKGAARPAVSPDGKWLAFNSTEQEEDLFVMNAEGGDLRQLTNGGYRNRGPRWSPDGKRIAYFSTRSGDWEIWTTDFGGSDFRQVTKLGGQNVAWPVWSANGSTLAYTVFGVNTFLLKTALAWEAQSPEKLPPFPAPGQLFNGWSWSPDGRALAGFVNRDEGIAIYTVASRTFRKVTEYGSDPVWLSDSRRILFHHRGNLHVLDTQTGSTHQLVSAAPEEIARRGFAVSPDDRRIYFSLSTTEADVWIAEN
jgi:Tol biopolymer transport system component